ncbi:protein shortage in chiasmata 1 ortholog [Cololabis saira]|uniref:protein shortage in chiasmata 1 ortholog n=1 Tax=Cololabis saira TaxID=129043 RepID=UPI002AD4262E|nr:protein shortage in chiasmata 1 ortholog [Cololabis saira]
MRCEASSCAADKLFPAVRFKALDYVFESSTSLRVSMNLLALPTPYLAESSALSSSWAERSYRCPWTRGKLIPSCKLFAGGSVLDDLGGKKQQLNPLERFDVKDDVEVIPSSNPDSLEDFDRDQNELQINNPCQESFFKLTVEQIKPGNKSKDLLLPAEPIPADHLSRMRPFPSLKTKLSRLGTIPVADPLLNSTGLVISADAMFRYVDTTDIHMSAFVPEEFVQESLMEPELLQLPAVLEPPQSTLQNFTAFSSLCSRMDVCPEPLDEECSVLDLLHKNSLSNTSVDIFQYDLPQDYSKDLGTSGDLIELGGLLVPSTDRELDLILSPTTKKSPTHITLSTSHLQREELSPFCRPSLMSAKTQEDLEGLVWKAEKCPTSVVRLLLSEPQRNESHVDFQPLREALRVITLETEGFSRAVDKLKLQVETGTPPVFLGSSLELTERFTSEFAATRVEEMEVFRKLLPEHGDDQAILLDPSYKDPRYEKPTPSTLTRPAVGPENRKESPAGKQGVSGNRSSAQTNDVRAGSRDGQAERSGHGFQPLLSSRQNVRDNDKSQVFKRRQPEKDVDPLSSFMMLRSQHALQVAVTPHSPDTTAAEEKQLAPEPELQTPPEQKATPDVSVASVSVAGDSAREQRRAAQWSSQLIHRPDSQSSSQERPGSRVLQVQATDSQQRAYRELLAFAQPCLSSARNLGLSFPSWGDFSCLAPDQTHFLLKQQERALCRTAAHDVEALRDQEQLLGQAALIHVLVTFRELLLKCDLSTAVVYLTKAWETSAEQSLQKLLKKLKIILYLSKKNLESNFKLLELQRSLSERLHGSKRQTAEKILVILSVDCDESRSVVISSLSRVVDAATSVCPEDDRKKLNGASVVSSVSEADCVVVYEQHIGPDFPWSCFSVVVEFDHPGQSPWSTVCSERSISHLTFNTTVTPDTDQTLWCLEDNVPFILFVTDGLLNRPLLLQTLESSFSVTVLERKHSPTLQMLGGIQNYDVITVDESTAIIFQEEDELGQERASEGLVMRLTALSLQYSCCWLILHCPDSPGGGFCSEAFSNLVLIYSSLVLFSMKSEDLDVKVLIVSEVVQTAKLIKQICFTTMMSSDGDTLNYLDRDWLLVIPSQEEECLSQFPCINPLVGQLMLSRAPSLQWLLTAALPELVQMFPDVPHKVLKLLSDTTSLYSTTGADPENAQTTVNDTERQNTPSKSPVSHAVESHTPDLDPDVFSSKHNTSFLFGGTHAEDSIFERDSEPAGFKLDLSCTFDSSEVHLQRSWMSSGLWREEHTSTFWSSRAGAAGRVVGREDDAWPPRVPPDDYGSQRHPADLPLNLDSTFSYSQFPRSDSQPPRPTWSLSPHTDPSSGRGQVCEDFLPGDAGATAAPANYGSRCWKGQERKRGHEASGLVSSVLAPTKRARLSYERVPGRMDGQTRLRLF